MLIVLMTVTSPVLDIIAFVLCLFFSNACKNVCGATRKNSFCNSGKCVCVWARVLNSISVLIKV